MKKILCCVLALMLGLLSLTAAAEQAPTTDFDYSAIVSDAYMSDYTGQGQKLVLDFHFDAGEDLLVRLPEKYRDTFNVLLDLLTLQFRIQTMEESQQYTLTLLLEQHEVVSVTAAVTADGMFMYSTLTDDIIFFMAPEELPDGFHQKMVNMLSDTTISADKLSALAAMFCHLMWNMPFVPDLLAMITTKAGLPLTEEYLVSLADSFLFSSALYMNESHTVNPDGTFVMGMDGKLEPENAEGKKYTPVLLRVTFESRDLGDHAEGTADIDIDMEGRGRLISARADVRTELADAWIDRPSEVVCPSMLTEKEQAALVRDAKENALFVLGLTLLRMPASVGTLISSFFFN